MSKVVSSKQQLGKLVSPMEKNPLLAKGISTKVQAEKLWGEISQELNCLGPPVRMAAKWTKVWADMKSKTKKKESQNISEYRVTGGGPNKLHVYTNIKEAIIDFLEFETCVNPPGLEFGLDVPGDKRQNIDATAANFLQEMIDEATTDNMEIEPNLTVGQKTTRKKRGAEKRKIVERVELLQMQTNMQKSYHEEMISTMNEIRQYTKQIYYLKKDTAKEILELKRQKLKIYKEKVLKRQQDRQSKLKLKVALLEMKKQMHPKL